jgi:hypothetical protein
MRFLLIATVALIVQPPAAPAPAPHAAEHHEFVIDNFKTESGVTLPKARVVYGTYGKLNAARDNVILVAVNLDPFATHESTLEIPLEALGIAADETYELHELLSDQRRLVRGDRHTVSLDPRTATAHVYRVARWRRRERDFDYYA